MAEYIEREAAKLRIFEYGVRHRDNSSISFACENLERQMNSIPAADVRPVVLCKDCRHRDPEDHKCDCGGTERQGCPFKVADDYFCAYGER